MSAIKPTSISSPPAISPDGLPNHIFNAILDAKYSVLEESVFSEDDLHAVASVIRGFHYRDIIAYHLISNLPKKNRNFDWNVGSILQHFDADAVRIALGRCEQREQLYNSIGLAWALGELRSRNRIFVDYLHAVVSNATDAEAWWRAAFSLEKIGIENAINLLKRSLKTEKINELDYYLHRLQDKKSVISILVLSNADNIEKKIYPRIKDVFLNSTDSPTIINCCWLIGRLRLIDGEILKRLVEFSKHKNYELKYYTFFALQNNATESLRPLLEKALINEDPLIRKMSARGLLNLGNERSLPLLEKAIFDEQNDAVVGELSRAIYNLKNPASRKNLGIELKSFKSENGMIMDETDKWYADPSIYDVFSEAEDPENLCFNLIKRKIGNKKIINPIDFATRTGRMLWQILEKIEFEGVLYGVDANKKMCDFLKRKIQRERHYTQPLQILQSTAKESFRSIKGKSSFIVSSFGFPSKIDNKRICREELWAVYELLEDDGLFFTIGWDETFNDELSEMWFKYVPDRIRADNFEEWRAARAAALTSARNSHLTWFKKGIRAPLQFSSIEDSAHVMGHLFGRDAAQWVIENHKTEWSMSLGITCNTKAELFSILQNYEKRS